MPMLEGHDRKPLCLEDDPLAYLRILVDTLHHRDGVSHNRSSVARGGRAQNGSDVRGQMNGGTLHIEYDTAERAEFVKKALDRALCDWDQIVSIGPITDPVEPFPHEQVYARIGRSTIHGVGVLAIVPIAKGTSLFPHDNDDLRWVKVDAVESIPPALQRLYTDFCVREDDTYGCPKNFSDLDASWYLNHSAAPNVKCDDDCNFIALCDITEGEELTVDYRTFSENEDGCFAPQDEIDPSADGGEVG